MSFSSSSVSETNSKMYVLFSMTIGYYIYMISVGYLYNSFKP